MVVNDLKSFARESLITLYGVVPFNNDDFGFFQEKIPGVYFFLGGSDFERGIISAPHSPYHAIDESCIGTGVNIFSTMLIQYLNER